MSHSRSWLLLAVAMTLLQSSGCGQSRPERAVSARPVPEHSVSALSAVPDPAPAVVASTTSTPILVLTPRCAASLRQVIQQNKLDLSKTLLFVSVQAKENCTGVEYQLEFRDLSQVEDAVRVSSEGISFGIERDDVPFLTGTTLDFLENPRGFKFNNPHEDLTLLSEYRKIKEDEDRRRPAEEAAANQIDPAHAVDELLTSRRQEAFDNLRLWWRFHQPKALHSIKAIVGRVDRYDLADGRSLTVVFTGAAEAQKGGLYIIDAQGQQIPVYHGQNYIGDNGQFVDVNGDGIPEIVAANMMGGQDEKDPGKIVTNATSLVVISIASAQVPLLSIVFDNRPFKLKSSWRWRLIESASGFRDIVLEEHRDGDWIEAARFTWSSNESNYNGPKGSKTEGFIACPGTLDVEQVKQFLKLEPQAGSPK